MADMSYKQKIKSVAKRAPGAKTYLNHRNLTKRAAEQDKEIAGLLHVIKTLEDRNDEWAAEVRSLRGDPGTMEILWPVRPKDLIEADYRQPMFEKLAKKHQLPLTFNWVLPPVGSVSGGHAVIFHMINYLESQGHTCRLYFYDPMLTSSLELLKKNLKNHPKLQAEIFYNQWDMQDCDAVFATSWHTAYPVFNYKGVGKKYYFVQDYEASFDAAGTYSALADNTYKMGLHGISTSPWAASKAKKDYKMKSDVIELGVAQGEYSLTNFDKPRKKILFYARPVTPRRGFELGALAFEIFHKEHPEYEINFIGWDTKAYNISFPYVNNGILGREELNVLYNECAAALALSFTSMSLLPVELMATGCKPVVNDADFTRMVGYAKGIQYAEPSPKALADALFAAATANEHQWLSEYSKKFSWDKTDREFHNILLSQLSS